jgi:hypothetical protein
VRITAAFSEACARPREEATAAPAILSFAAVQWTMNVRVALSAVSAVAALSAPAAAAGTLYAPPTLTPLVAREVIASCPGTARYAAALVDGISETDAAAAAPLFDACAASHRRDVSNELRQAASTAVGATYLALGTLRHDPALLRRAVDATAELRSQNVYADDATVRAWTIIPDQYDARGHVLVVRTDCPTGTLIDDATYVNVAAHAGGAWIATPRAPAACPPLSATALAAAHRAGFNPNVYADGSGRTSPGRPNNGDDIPPATYTSGPLLKGPPR